MLRRLLSRNYIIMVMVTTVIVSLCGCNQIGTSKKGIVIDYLPYQDKGEKYGLIGLDGKVLFEPEMKRPISPSINGVFIEWKDGKVALWKAQEEPEQIGDDYVAAGYFLTDIAPVVEEGQPVKFINKKGEEVFTLNKLKDKLVVAVTNFSDGLCPYQTEEGLWGYINNKGECVIPATFSKVSPFKYDRAFVMEAKYDDKPDKEKVVSIIDPKGTVIKKIDYKDTDSKFFQSTERLLCIGNSEDGYGIMDRDGNVLIKKNRKYNRLQVYGDDIIFTTDNGTGLMDVEKNIKIKPKYDGMMPSKAPGLYIASKSKDEDLVVINDKGEKKLEIEEELVLPFLDGKHAVVKDKECYFIDLEGKEIDNESYFQIMPFSKVDEILNNALTLVIEGENAVDMFPNTEAWGVDKFEGIMVTEKIIPLKAKKENAERVTEDERQVQSDYVFKKIEGEHKLEGYIDEDEHENQEYFKNCYAELCYREPAISIGDDWVIIALRSYFPIGYLKKDEFDKKTKKVILHCNPPKGIKDGKYLYKYTYPFLGDVKKDSFVVKIVTIKDPDAYYYTEEGKKISLYGRKVEAQLGTYDMIRFNGSTMGVSDYDESNAYYLDVGEDGYIYKYGRKQHRFKIDNLYSGRPEQFWLDSKHKTDGFHIFEIEKVSE